MKVNRTLISYCFVLTCILFQECKKYPEDPYEITFRTFRSRLRGAWSLENISVDGWDSTSFVRSQTCIIPYVFDHQRNLGDWRFRLRVYPKLPTFQQNVPPCFSILFHNMAISRNKRILTLTLLGYIDAPNIGPYMREGQPVNWEIIELTHERLTLRAIENGHVYITKHVKFNDLKEDFIIDN